MTTIMDPDSRPDYSTQVSLSSSFFYQLVDQTTPSSFHLSDTNVDDYLESQNLQFMSDLAPTLFYIVLLISCGLVGNTVVFLVYYKRFKPSVTRTYILAMSVCDLLTNVLSLPMDVVEVRFHNSFDSRWTCKCFRTVKSFLGFLSACVLVVVAIDRHQTICSPRSKPTSIKRILVILAVSALLGFAITSPYTVLTGRQTLHYEGTNITGSRCSIDDAYTKSRFLFIYNMITGLVFVVCITLMIVSYVRIARQLWLHRKHTSVTGRAVGDRTNGSTLHNTHTYIDEETCVDGTQMSMDAEVLDDQPDSNADSAHRGPDLQENTLNSSCSNSEVALAENPGKLLCVPQPKVKGNQVSNPKTNTCGIPLKNTKPWGTENVASSSMNHNACCDTEADNVDPKTSDPKQPSQTLSRSHAVFSRIRRTTSDAKSFITRNKSISKPRGSVRKIPTRTTFMMFVLTIIFIVNYLPYLLLVSLRSRLSMKPLVDGLGLNGYHIGLRSYFINCAVNPLVYSFCSARFRQECLRLFRCKKA